MEEAKAPSSPRLMRKVATNANMQGMVGVAQSFGKHERSADRVQLSRFAQLDHSSSTGGRHASDAKSPVIITSLDKSPRKPAQSIIVFDVRSETPKSGAVGARNTPQIG